MEEAMEKFENMVGSTEEKLDNMEKRIDAEFSKHLDPYGEEEGEEDKVTLLRKLEEVKAEYATLCHEAAEVSSAQREVAKQFQQELMAQVKQMQALQDRGFNPSNGAMDHQTESALNSLVEQSEVAENLSQKFKTTT